MRTKVRTYKLLKLADYIEQDTGTFNMARYGECIAGKCLDMLGIPNTHPSYEFTAVPAAEYLGLTFEESKMLFSMYGFYPTDMGFEQAIGKLKNTTKEQAVRTIRHFAITGVIDWDIPEPKEVHTALPPFKVPVRNGFMERLRELIPTP